MSKRAVLIVNLGSPASTSVSDVRRYLREFLGDERVLDISAPMRWALLEGIILRTRPKKSAHAYSTVWTDQGSPLVVTSLAVQQKLVAKLAPNTPVYLAMRYGQPSIASVVAKLTSDGIDDLLIFPQYPHYAMSSWETVVVKVVEEIARQAPRLRATTIQPFFDDADYIEALYARSRPYLEQPHDYVLFSYHGLPARHMKKADSSKAHCLIVPDCCEVCSPVQSTCYRSQCLRTTKAFVQRAGLKAGTYSISFQSRLAGEPWLTPYTDFEFERLPKAGVKKLLVMTPAFVADCLETLEEIAVAGKKSFIQAGGETFQQIPCLNDDAVYIDFLHGRVTRWLNRVAPEGPKLLPSVLAPA